MSYGPQLPPHLLKKKEEEEESRDSGPKDSSSDDDGDFYGPKLPDQPCRGPAPSSSSSQTIGPMLPSQASSEPQDDTSSDDDDIIGPRPPAPGEEISSAEAIARQFEERARKMRDKIEGKTEEEAGQPKRETWMLELPPELRKNFGLGPRTFSQKTGPKTAQDKSWTKAPNDAGKDDGQSEDPMDDKDVLEYMATLKRDQEMEKVSNQLSEKRGTESLMERHSKKLKKEKAESNRPNERRPFDRDLDLQVNRFDEAQKKSMMKKAAELNSRFSSGASKFL